MFPPGYKFVPSDVDLVGYYLRNKVLGLPLHCDIIKDCDLYGSQEPWEIWELYGGTSLDEIEDLYFFTLLKKKSTKGSRICRKIGSGAWQGEDAAKGIEDNVTRKLVGSKKRFRYEKKGSVNDGKWIMQEYTLLGQGHDQCVLCRIRKNDQSCGYGKRSLGKNRKFQEVEVPEVEKSKCFSVEQQEPVHETTNQQFVMDYSAGNAATGLVTLGEHFMLVPIAVADESQQSNWFRVLQNQVLVESAVKDPQFADNDQFLNELEYPDNELLSLEEYFLLMNKSQMWWIFRWLEVKQVQLITTMKSRSVGCFQVMQIFST